MLEEDYLTPIVGQIIGAVITIGAVYVCTRITDRWLNRKIAEMDREKLTELRLSQQ